MIDDGKLALRPGILEHRRILVTGGGTGVGRMIAEGCAALGATVYICGRRGAILDETAASVNEQLHVSRRIRPLACDLRSAEAIEAMLSTIWDDDGPLDGLVNNAAANFIARAEDISANGFDAIAETVMRGSFLVTTGCGRRWLADGHSASVVSILVTWVRNGGPFAIPAAMSKAGLWAMTQSLAVEWGGRGIRVNAVAPGAVPTESVKARLLVGEQGRTETGANPMGRYGTPEDIANIVAFLLAPGSEFVSGQFIAVDGAGFQGNGANFSALTAWTDQEWKNARAKIRGADARDKIRRTTTTEAQA